VGSLNFEEGPNADIIDPLASAAGRNLPPPPGIQMIRATVARCSIPRAAGLPPLL